MNPFERLWDELQRLSPLQIDELVVTTDDRKMSIEYGGKSPFCVSKKKASEHFQQLSTGRKISSGYFKKVCAFMSRGGKAPVQAPAAPAVKDSTLPDGRATPPRSAATRTPAHSTGCIDDFPATQGEVSMKRDIRQCARAFIDWLQGRARHAPFDVRDENNWVDRAIVASQGQGNPKGSHLRLSDALKGGIERCLRQWRSLVIDDNLVGYHQFETVTAESMHTMHSLAEVLDPGCLLLFGRVQKIHNIWLKYQIALYFSGYTPSRGVSLNPGLGKLLQWAHVPIDNIVLNFMFKNKLAPTQVTNIGATRLDWKLRLQMPRYMTLQDYLRKAAKAAGYDSPLHYEMDLIWKPTEDVL